MPEWLKGVPAPHVDLTLADLLTKAELLALALALGGVVALIYRATRRPSDGPSLVPTLVLLTLLIAMVIMIIGDSIAKAFVLGALAIVRFRTVVEDTRDTAFVIFAMGVGMAVGSNNAPVALLGIPFVAVAAFLFRPRDAEAANDFTLKVRIGAGRPIEALVREPFAKHLKSWRLTGTSTARQGVALDLTYSVRLCRDEEALGLVTALNGIDGIQEVELRQNGRG